MGGDGDERHASLQSGANVVAKLRRYPDIQVEAFLLPPTDAAAGEARRRAALLGRATEYSVLGIPEAEWPEGMRWEELRWGCGLLGWLLVWCGGGVLSRAGSTMFPTDSPTNQTKTQQPARRHMSPMSVPLSDRLVWCVQEAQLQRPGVESALAAAEAAAALQKVAYWGAAPEQRQAREVQLEVQRELDYLLVQVGDLVV
jgi:hypothetical protein